MIKYNKRDKTGKFVSRNKLAVESVFRGLHAMSELKRRGKLKMGWATGAEVAQKLWSKLKHMIPEDLWIDAQNHITDVFEEYDCDNIDEVEW